MMWILNLLVGSKVKKAVTTVLAVGLIIIGTIQYIQWQERDKIITEIQREDLENYKDTRERIDEAINGDTDNRDSDALDWLRKRLNP